MLDRLLGFQVHHLLHFVGALILVVGLPFNKVLMSIGSIWLVANLILEADFSSYWKRLKGNYVFWAVTALFLFHITGLFYSENSTEAFHDIRTKLPLISIPLGLIAKPLEDKYIKYVLYAFLFMLCLTSFVNVFFLFVSGDEKLGDLRYMSRFGSHIRYGLLISFGAGIALVNILFSYPNEVKKRYWWIIFLWLTFYTILSQVGSAILAFSVMLTCLIVIKIIFIPNKTVRISLISIIGIGGIVFSTFLGRWSVPLINDFKESELESFSASGNPYYHDVQNTRIEGGKPVFIYIVDEEVQQQWEQKSQIPFYGKDKKGQQLKTTLYRYMTSKGLRKDREGMLEMTANDIENVENGIASFYQRPGSPFARFEELRSELYSYYAGASPDGNSLLQRLEYWKMAVLIIKEHPWFGVGTGDVNQSFYEMFKSSNSKLDDSLWKRSHNQFLTFWVSFGVFGLLSFLLIWYFSLIQVIRHKNWIGLLFILIALTSFITEDTLETQQGVTFIAFFLGFLPFLGKKEMN